MKYGFLATIPLVLLTACQSEDNKGPFADPWTVMLSEEVSPIRSHTIKRGIVHSHSPYSHDACDGKPFVEGVRDESCFNECRQGMCASGQDFVFLTDHDSHFAEHEFPDVLLFATGDELIERNGKPVANRLDCGDGRRVIVAAGTETGMMPIGLEHHVGDSLQERNAAYNEVSEQAVGRLQDAGALVFLQHTEEWSIEDVLRLPIDGIECYNLHRNMLDNMAVAVEMALVMETHPERLPEIELALIAVFQENEADLIRWAHAVAQEPMPAVLATDAHRNVFANPSPDGERLDSFRRMMHWFSNYVLLPTDFPDDADLKQAIAHGRMYAGFDYLGYPVGFDFHAVSDGVTYEMGDSIETDRNVSLQLKLPKVYRLDPQLPTPAIRGRILKSQAGEWVEVAGSEQDIQVDVEQGAYRAEVRIVPEHLRPWLGPDADELIRDLIWVYSNPIYVNMDF